MFLYPSLLTRKVSLLYGLDLHNVPPGRRDFPRVACFYKPDIMAGLDIYYIVNLYPEVQWPVVRVGGAILFNTSALGCRFRN